MGKLWQLEVRSLLKSTLAGALLCCASIALAGESPLGKKIEGFSLPDYHGKMHSLDDYQGKAVVIAFTGTECPLVKNYAPRLKSLAEEFADKGVAFLAINSNVQDSLTEIGAQVRSYQIPFPVLKDNGNVVADKIGAVRTPEVFLLDKDRVVRYWGRIDDQYGFKTGAGYVKPKLKERFLADAITQVLAGQPVARPEVASVGCFIGRVATKGEAKGDVTYANQIARIMQKNCVECHRPGEVAPFTLLSYDDVSAWAETIKEVVSEGRMPPWFADPRFGHFLNDARLSDTERDQLFAWIDAGCPEGDSEDLPEPRKFVEGWQIGQPDQILTMKESYTVPAEGTVDYQFFSVDPGWTEDKWIQATECRPGNRAVVHHIIAMLQGPGGNVDLGARGGLGGYAPGMTPNVCAPGTAIHVPAGSKLVFQMHYTTNGTEQTDKSQIGIKFADKKTVKQIVRSGLVGNTAFKIPPGDGNYEVKARHLFLKDTLILNLTPHMHVRGKDFKFVAEYPDGKQEVLLDVPSYDFNWQLRYMLAEPKLMPKGTRLHCTAHFDNSVENLANPDPTKAITFGEQTWEEMMFGFYTSVDPKQDLTEGLADGSADKGDQVAGEATAAAAAKH